MWEHAAGRTHVALAGARRNRVSRHDVLGEADIQRHRQANEAGQIDAVVQYDAGAHAQAHVNGVPVVIGFWWQYRLPGCDAVALVELVAGRALQTHVWPVPVAAVAGSVALVTKVGALGVDTKRVVATNLAIALQTLVYVRTTEPGHPGEPGPAHLARMGPVLATVQTRPVAGPAQCPLGRVAGGQLVGRFILIISWQTGGAICARVTCLTHTGAVARASALAKTPLVVPARGAFGAFGPEAAARATVFELFDAYEVSE